MEEIRKQEEVLDANDKKGLKNGLTPKMTQRNNRALKEIASHDHPIHKYRNYHSSSFLSKLRTQKRFSGFQVKNIGVSMRPGTRRYRIEKAESESSTCNPL